jgi:HlyD family secretion protein
MRGISQKISPQANRQKATVHVKLQITNPDECLRPEMNSTVEFVADEERKADAPSGVLVPSASVKDRDGKKVVFLAFQGKALLREVKIMSHRGGAT